MIAKVTYAWKRRTFWSICYYNQIITTKHVVDTMKKAGVP
jgi:hypothetical protein